VLWFVVFVLVLVLAAFGYLGIRWTRRPPVAPDLRRADEAEEQEMPSADEAHERIGEAFGETRPPGA